MNNLIANNRIKSCIFTFKSKKKRKTKFAVDFTAALNLPIIYNPVLDETLDSAKIQLSNICAKDYREFFIQHGLDVTVAFEINTIVEIKFEKLVNGRYVEQDTSIKMLISHDDCRMQRKSENIYRSYKHDIQLIELTKKLERISVDTLTFTNPIPREFDTNANATWSGTQTAVAKAPSLKMVHLVGTTITIAGNQNKWEWSSGKRGTASWGNSIKSITITVSDPLGKDTHYNMPLVKVNTRYENYTQYGIYVNSSISVTLNRTGTWTITYNVVDSYSTKEVSTQITVSTAATLSSPVSTYTLKDTVNRLLNVTPLRSASEKNLFEFDKTQLEEYEKEESPEFAFTGHTLFEALLQIASYKGSFPYLRSNDSENEIISFRSMWNGIRLSEDELPAAIDDVSSTDIEQYCTCIETEVQNLVGLNNCQMGTVTEPYAGGYVSTRAESGSEVSQDTALISTHYAMYLHIDEIFADCATESIIKEYTITPYIYESGDYEALSDYYANYPDSKVYALKWTQMAENITELSHRLKNANSVDEIFFQPTLANILSGITGENYSSGIVSYIANLIGLNNDKGHGFADLMFRTKYIPLINARIKQYKENFTDFHHNGSIKYNQSAELVDSEMYGEHLKELMRKLGNRVRSKVYEFNNLDSVPKVGTLIGNDSVYDVQMSIRENLINVTISYVKYAELSQFIGVKNAWKDSDVSVDKCYERQISYNEFLLFTHDSSLISNSKSLSKEALAFFLPSTTSYTLTCVEATGKNIHGETLNTVLLPVVSIAMGNSVLFHWKYKNNYSAGYMSQPAPNGATSVLSGTKYNRAQKMVKYSDSYGRLQTLSYYIMPTGPVPDGENIGWMDGSNVILQQSYVARNIAHSLPLKPEDLMTTIKYYGSDGEEYTAWERGWVGNRFISVNDLQIEKNSSESLTFETQYHYCTDITTEIENTDFIIGSGLSNFCPLVGGNAVELAIYGFTERLNIFNRHISINSSQATLISSGQLIPSTVMDGEFRKLKINIPNKVNAKNADGSLKYKAWAYVGRANANGSYQIIFGENKGLDETVEFDTTVYLLPMHKLEDFI